MRNVLARAQQPLLRRFARSSVLLAFDFDGTLAPIVADPERAAMRARTARLFAELTRLYPCVVVSGRARADVRARLDGARVRAVIGNHGVESWQRRNGLAARVRGWRERVERVLGGHAGVWVEDKTLSLAIHYRHAREKEKARAAVQRAAATLAQARIVGGKQVVNVVPAGAPDKGDAVEQARARLGCARAIYVGDDETDEDVFRRADPDRLLAIRVGVRRDSRAPFCLRDQRQIDALLEALVALRQCEPG